MLFRSFTDSLPYLKLFDGYRLLACDGYRMCLIHEMQVLSSVRTMVVITISWIGACAKFSIEFHPKLCYTMVNEGS